MKTTEPRILPKLANPWVVGLRLITSLDEYCRLAPQHNLAVNLKSRDLSDAYQRGDFPRAGWNVEAIEDARSHAIELRTGLSTSFLVTLFFLLAGLILGYITGRISPELPLSESKLLSTAGAFLAGWATLFELGGYSPTFGGRALHEIVRPVIFKSLFLPVWQSPHLGKSGKNEA